MNWKSIDYFALSIGASTGLILEEIFMGPAPSYYYAIELTFILICFLLGVSAMEKK